MNSELKIIQEAYIGMLSNSINEETFTSKNEWTAKVSKKHPDAKHKTEDGVHVARDSNDNIVAAFKYNKGMNVVSGSGHIK